MYVAELLSSRYFGPLSIHIHINKLVNNMATDLIVGFPKQNRGSRSALAVHFNQEMEVTFFQRYEEAESILWYTSKELKAMKQDARNSGCTLYLLKSSSSARYQCWKAVLGEQKRQRRLNEEDPEMIASISRSHTQESERRARAIALMQREMMSFI